MQHNYFLFLSFSLVTDAVDYLKQQEKNSRSQRQLVNTSSPKEISPNCLTDDDVILSKQNLPLQQYDAFILFADQDIDFATEMIEKVEAFGLKVRRHLLGHSLSDSQAEN